jgi:hypothetical protein
MAGSGPPGLVAESRCLRPAIGPDGCYRFATFSKSLSLLLLLFALVIAALTAAIMSN